MEEKIKKLIVELNAASDAYYGGKEEVMTNFEWDAKFDELSKLEAETGIVFPDSPTQSVSHSDGDDNVAGQKEKHEFPALSLAKTKDIEKLKDWAGDREVNLSWKLDGLTIVATYDNGKISKLLTRGNGEIGTNITFMKDVIRGLPKKIDYKGHLVVRGEAAISYTDFDLINANLPDDQEPYANPRNLASGTLSLDDSHLDVVKERNLTFNAFTLVHIDEPMNSWSERMEYLRKLGFIVVDYEKATKDTLADCVSRWTKLVEDGKMDIPVDGLVICYDDVLYAQGGSITGHHATRAGFAFKWQDEVATTNLRSIVWSCATSVITPVAVFDPVQLEGTTVTRASLCNLSELERLGILDEGKTVVNVIKANKIIPKIVGVVKSEGTLRIPEKCPVCNHPTKIEVGKSGVKILKCSNEDCAAKKIKKFVRFVSKEGMDIDGMSIQTVIRFMNEGYLNSISDIYRLHEHAEAISEMDGFGKRSCEKLMASIEKSKNTDPIHFIKALSIPMIGRDATKKIVGKFGWNGFLKALDDGKSFEDIDGIGEERSKALSLWYADEKNKQLFGELLSILNIKGVEPAGNTASGVCSGLTFVITGDVHHFKNRDEFKEFVESAGGKVAGSVSKKTNYLVNNDAASTSGKNKKAKELGISIITEDEFVAKFKS